MADETQRKGLILISNKDERAMARQALPASFGSFSMYGHMREGLSEIIRTKGAIDLLVLDERFDNDAKHEAEGLKVIDLLEAFNRSENRPDDAVVVVILHESTTIEAPILYTEIGVDLFLRRPFGVQELKEKITEAASWRATPPASVKLMRVFLSHVRRARYDEVLGGLESLHEQNPQNIRVGMLLARALIGKGGEHRTKGIAKALKLDELLPQSLFAKRLLIEGYLSQGEQLEAFRHAARLYECNPSEDNFRMALALAEKLSVKETAGTGAPWLVLLEAMGDQEPIRTKDRRLQVLRQAAQSELELPAITRFLSYLATGQEDILPQTKEVVEHWTSKVRGKWEADPSDRKLESLLVDGLRLLLEIEPGLPAAIERFTELQIRRQELKQAEKYLFAARDKNKTSVEYYSAFVKLSLEEGLLKEASDLLHAGRRLAPSDDRWDVLAKIWSAKYAAAGDQKK